MPHPHTVLVIDDDPGIRDVLVDAFEMEGHATLAACNGAEALDLLASVPVVDLIITDVKMPVMSGPEFIRAYRERPAPHAPIVAVAASREGLVMAQAAQPSAAVAKPFDLDQFLTLVEALLQGHRPNAAA